MTVPRKKHRRQARNTIQRTYVFTFSTTAAANDDAPGPPEPWLDPGKGPDAETPERPGGSEGQFFGQVGSALFVSRCDETKWGAFRPHFCR